MRTVSGRRREYCPFAGIPSSSVLKRLLKGEGGAAEWRPFCGRSRVRTVRQRQKHRSRLPTTIATTAATAVTTSYHHQQQQPQAH